MLTITFCGVHVNIIPDIILKLCIFAWQVVEVSKGSKVKYELDKASGLIKVMPLLLIHPFHMFLEVIVSYMAND